MSLDELCRVAARRVLAAALLAERRAYLDAHAEVVDDDIRRMVVGNGYARPREVMTGAGMVEVKAPRVDDRRADHRYSSAIVNTLRSDASNCRERVRSLGLRCPLLPVRTGGVTASVPPLRPQRRTRIKIDGGAADSANYRERSRKLASETGPR